MQSHADTLAILEGGFPESLESLIENLIESYGGLQDDDVADSRPESTQPTDQAPILDDHADILNLRGRLQQMGATFDSSGELLTYGNPESSSEFESMLKLGPLYEEQWNTSFVKDHVPDSDGDKWSDLHTLKKILNNEGIVFGNAGQRYSVGDSSEKLRRLCLAYDKLWVHWRNVMNTELATQEENDKLSTIEEETPEDPDAEFVDDIVHDGIVHDDTVYDDTVHDDTVHDGVFVNAPPYIIQRRCRPLSADNDMSDTDNDMPDNMDWPFSTGITQPPPRNQWHFSDNLESVPVWNDVEQATIPYQTIPATTDAQPTIGGLLVSQNSPLEEIETYPANVRAPGMQRAPFFAPLDLQETVSLGPQAGHAQIITGTRESSIRASIVVDGEDSQHGKKDGKLRRWFRHAFVRK